jgi:hypothetical protein
MPTLQEITTSYNKYQMKKSRPRNKVIHIGSIAPISSMKKSAIFCQALEAMCELGFSVSVMAEGNEETQKCCFELLEKYPEQFEVLESIDKNKQEILNTVDAVIFAENPAKKVLAEVIANNVVAILPEGNGLKDFDLKHESGEAFTFREGNIWSFVSAIVRAGENFKFPYDWKTIKHNLEMIVF